MALSANTVWEVRSGGDDTNGGGFVTGAAGTDWSLQNAAQYSVTDGVTAGTTTITSATANFGTDVVGNIIYVQGGTGSVTAGWYQIISRTNSTTIVVDRSTGLTAGTGVTLKIGGAFASPGRAAAVAVSGNITWWKNDGSYTCSTGTAGAGGPVAWNSNITWRLEGYKTTRGDLIDPPTLSAGAQTGITLFQDSAGSGGLLTYVNCKADGNNGASNNGFSLGNASSHNAIKCVAVNCPGSGFISGRAWFCKAESCGTGFGGVDNYFCYAEACTNGFSPGAMSRNIGCLAEGCTTRGFASGSQDTFYLACTAYGNTGDGYQSATNSVFINCVAYGNGGFGFNTPTSSRLHNCAAGSNTSGNTNSTPNFSNNFVTLTADPANNAASDDYRPNNTAGGGAAIRAAALDLIDQTVTRDIGAMQHSDPAGGSTAIPPFGVISTGKA